MGSNPTGSIGLVKTKVLFRRDSMQVVMLVNYANYGEGKVVKIVKAEGDWLRTSGGIYLQKEWARTIGGTPIGKEVVI